MANTFIEGLGTMVIGMFTVFAILIILAFVLYLLRFVNKEDKPKTEMPIQPIIEPVKEEIVSEDLTDDLELIAVITASIALSLGVSSDKFQVTSIKRVSNWNMTARKEHQQNNF